MKTILLLFATAAAVLLPSCSAFQGVNGRVVTQDGEVTVLPDGRIEIIVNPKPTK